MENNNFVYLLLDPRIKGEWYWKNIRIDKGNFFSSKKKGRYKDIMIFEKLNELEDHARKLGFTVLQVAEGDF